jgi:hypothetical protein
MASGISAGSMGQENKLDYQVETGEHDEGHREHAFYRFIHQSNMIDSSMHINPIF